MKSRINEAIPPGIKRILSRKNPRHIAYTNMRDFINELYWTMVECDWDKLSLSLNRLGTNICLDDDFFLLLQFGYRYKYYIGTPWNRILKIAIDGFPDQDWDEFFGYIEVIDDLYQELMDEI